MKNISFIVTMLLFFFGANAQDISWTKAYEQLYGTRQQYMEQIQIRNVAGYNLYQLVGHKSYYTNGPSSFLQQTQHYSMEAKETNGKITYTLTRKNEYDATSKCQLTFWLDNDDRVTKARFTGDTDALTFLFQNYWPSKSMSTFSEEVTKGAISEKRLQNEKIVFNFSGQKPYIELVRLN